MLTLRESLDGLTARGLACTFNLRPGTAEQLIERERQRREAAA